MQKKKGWQNCQPYFAYKPVFFIFVFSSYISIFFMNHVSDLDSRVNMSNSCCTSIMVRSERQDAAKAVIAEKLLMWWLCASRVLVTVSSGGAVTVTMWDTYSACWAPVLRRILASAMLCCGAQLHSPTFLSSWSTLLWFYFNLSGQFVSETSVSSAACRLWIWTWWWNVHVLYAHWWWKTGTVYKDDTQLFTQLSSRSVLNEGCFFVDHLCCVLHYMHSAWTYKITGTCVCAAPAGAC